MSLAKSRYFSSTLKKFFSNPKLMTQMRIKLVYFTQLAVRLTPSDHCLKSY